MSENLSLFSAQIRLETCKMLAHRGFGHLGGALSIVETLSVLYGEKMNIDPKQPNWPGRDYFVLSKGHAGPSYYSTLALKGYFPLEVLNTLNENGTNLPSHPDRLKTIGVDATTGSLGQGISIAVGIAKALKLDNKSNKVYSIVGDGECNEGQVWEAFQFAAHQKLDNLLVFIDENHKQLDGLTVDINNPFDLRAKMEAFGFYALRVDGADEKAISEAIDDCFAHPGQALCIVLDTVKGQGVEFFEKLFDNHHIRFATESKAELDKAIVDLEDLVSKGGVR
ncbi:MAG: transketolase [Erysipelotrichaceae bacterium]|nr:transketolase [Erysipelotrichaceae bacterium]MDP3305397.1 transketolase [Erysipelotrichaceae bacterium]